VAHDAATGKPLWHSRIGAPGNAPETFILDGRQYVLATMTHPFCFGFVMSTPAFAHNRILH
jgi:alcohol dehydrogenase (cytochrome c)